MNLRFGSFNLYQFAKPPAAWYEPQNTYNPSDWASKQEWIADQLLKMNADIVGFQEVFSPDELKKLVAESGYEHFETVAEPLKQDGVFVSSVVAIASRHPILSVSALDVSVSVKESLSISDDFNFSRKPLRAVVSLPGIGETTVYVAHLKSKRPSVETREVAEDAQWMLKVSEAMRALSAGPVASMIQRGAEATTLYHDVSEVLSSSGFKPVIVLGDMNDGIRSIPIGSLVSRGRLYEVSGTKYDDLPIEAKRLIHSYRLVDAFDMASNPEGNDRTPTHYHRGEGGTLDYIFLSNSFNERNPDHVARTVRYDVFDQHILSDGVGDKKQSDHAQVVVEIQPV